MDVGYNDQQVQRSYFYLYKKNSITSHNTPIKQKFNARDKNLYINNTRTQPKFNNKKIKQTISYFENGARQRNRQ